jgi:mono/diheme cytochrome c family protein
VFPRRVAGPLLALSVVCAATVAAQRSSAPPPVDGRALFDHACRSCHNGEDPRAPAVEALAGRSPQAIVDALTSGSMRYQGLALSGAERRAFAEFLTGRPLR